jgi:S1-C subfamily serine protease
LPGSIAFRAGLKKGDTIVSVDDWKVESVVDVKIALFDKKEGDKINVKVIRKRFLFGKKVIEFNITL